MMESVAHVQIRTKLVTMTRTFFWDVRGKRIARDHDSELYQLTSRPALLP